MSAEGPLWEADREEAGDLPALALPQSGTVGYLECTVQLLPGPDGQASFRAVGEERCSFCKYRLPGFRLQR